MKKVLSTLAIAGLISGTAQATNRTITLDFDVVSSSSRFVICGAGISHNGTTISNNIDHGIGNTIAGKGEQDLMVIENTLGHKYTLQNGTVDYYGSFDSVSQQYKGIKRAELKLRSDLYGAEWYFKMCYYPSNASYTSVPFPTPNDSHTVSASAHGHNFINSYMEDSGLSFDITSNCGLGFATGHTSVSSGDTVSDSTTDTTALGECSITYTFKENTTGERDHSEEAAHIDIMGQVVETHHADHTGANGDL